MVIVKFLVCITLKNLTGTVSTTAFPRELLQAKTILASDRPAMSGAGSESPNV